MLYFHPRPGPTEGSERARAAGISPVNDAKNIGIMLRMYREIDHRYGTRLAGWSIDGGVLAYYWAELLFSSAADRPQARESVPGGHILPVDFSDVFSIFRRLDLRSRRFWRASRTTISARVEIAGRSLSWAAASSSTSRPRTSGTPRGRCTDSGLRQSIQPLCWPIAASLWLELRFLCW